MIQAIAVFLVVVVVNVFMISAVLRAAGRINDKVNAYFIDKVTSIVPPERKHEEEEIEAEVKEEPERHYSTAPLYHVDTDKKDGIYKTGDYHRNYKNIKEKMGFDADDIIESVMKKEHDNANVYAGIAESLVKTLDLQTVYSLNTLSSHDQLTVLKSSLDDYQKELLEEYRSNYSDKPFNIVEFKEYVSKIAISEDPNFYVKTGLATDYYDDLGNNVVTVHDESITEGVKIVHKDKVYDYSI